MMMALGQLVRMLEPDQYRKRLRLAEIGGPWTKVVLILLLTLISPQ